MLSDNAQFWLILVGTVVSGFLLSLLWGRLTRPDTFDRNTMMFLAKMWLAIGAVGTILYVLAIYQ